MLHDIAVVYCLSTSECQVGLSNDLVDTFLAMSTLLDQLALYIQMIHSLKCCMLQFCYIAVTFFYICI